MLFFRSLRHAVLLSIALTPAAVGQNLAASFNGQATNSITVQPSPDLAPPTGLTIECWARVPSNMSSRFIFLKLSNPTYATAVYRVLGPQLLAAIRGADGSQHIIQSGYTMPSNAWIHIALTFDNSVLRLFVNGQLNASDSIAGPLYDTPGELRLGGASPGGNEAWLGDLDAVRLWSYARSQQQIQAAMGVELENQPGLVASWHLDGSFLDSTGNHDGTMVGSIPLLPSTAPVVPMLQAPSPCAIGGVAAFTIKNVQGLVPYVFDISVTGTSPGTPIGPGQTFPLNQPLLNLQTGGALQSYFSGFFGILDATGSGNPSLLVPPDPSLAGSSLDGAYCVLDSGPPAAVTFTSSPAHYVLAGFSPAIGSISPGVAAVGTTPMLTITGSHFEPGATVTIGGQPATSVMVQAPASVTCVPPLLSVGQYAVTVTNLSGCGATVSGGYTVAIAPVISQVNPVSAAPGAAVTVTGSSFVAPITLNVGGIPVVPTSVTATQITFPSPANVPCNTMITVTNGAQLQASAPFDPMPTVTSIYPATVPATQFNLIVIQGSDFFAGAQIVIDGIPALYWLSNSGLLFLQAPPGPVGGATVTITSAGGCTTMTGFARS